MCAFFGPLVFSGSLDMSTHRYRYYSVFQKLLCSKVPRITLQFFLQQILEMSPTGLKTCLDTLLHCATGVLSSGPWGTFSTSAVGRTATWYVVLYCTVAFGALCIMTVCFVVWVLNSVSVFKYNANISIFLINWVFSLSDVLLEGS
jgi:hypothetical protein